MATQVLRVLRPLVIGAAFLVAGSLLCGKLRVPEMSVSDGYGAAVSSIRDTEPLGCSASRLPLVISGLWLIDGNKKHSTSFFTGRLAANARAVARKGHPMVLFAGSTEIASVGATSFASQEVESGVVLETRLLKEAQLPYSIAANAVVGSMSNLISCYFKPSA